MSSKYKRKELLVFGWCRETCKCTLRTIPVDIMRIVESILISDDFVQWKIKISDQNDPKGVSIIVDGITFNLSLEKSKSNNSRHKFIVRVGVVQSCLIASTISITVAIRIEGDVVKTKNARSRRIREKHEIKLESNGEQLDTKYTRRKFKEFDLKFSFEIIEIKYFKMKINSCLKWNVKRQRLNIDGVQCEFNNLSLSIWTGFDVPILWIEAILPAMGVTTITIEYILIIEGMESDEKVTNLRIIDQKELTDVYAGGTYLCQWKHAGCGIYTKLCITMEIKVIKINGEKVSDIDHCDEYGLF